MAANLPVTTSSKTQSLWAGKDWEWQCPADNKSGSPFHCCMVGRGWDEHWTVSHLLADVHLIHLCWLMLSHSQGGEQPPSPDADSGGCTSTAHRSLLHLKTQGSQNKHKIAVRKRVWLKYCSYEGGKNKKLQIRWVPHSCFVQITWKNWKEVDIRYTEVEESLEEKAKSLSC